MRTPEFWTRKDFRSRLVASALTPAGWLYGASVAWRARLSRPQSVSAKVVCVGNVTAGGTGKTPVAITIAEALLAAGWKVAFLSRGYGGRAKGPLQIDAIRHSARDVGDEPLLLARVAPTFVARNRHAGAQLAIANGAEVIVLDDGHQNFDLAKALSIIVMDAQNPAGNGRMLPAGPLRETMAQGLSRADAIVLVGDGEAPVERGSLPVLRAHIQPQPRRALVGRRLFAFAGIGQPDRFFDMLRMQGAEIAGKLVFADHHLFGAAEIANMKSLARAANADLITTEKDFMRLSPGDRNGLETLPIHAVFDESEALPGLMERFGMQAKR